MELDVGGGSVHGLLQTIAFDGLSGWGLGGEQESQNLVASELAQ